MNTVYLGRTNEGKGRDADFIRLVEQESGQSLSACYQCGNCTAGCPMSFTYDYSVSQVMRLLQLGQKETVLTCRAIWLCATCETCTTRCPNNIAVAQIMDVCRHMARREGYAAGMEARNIRVFVDSFLQTVRLTGRAYELGTMGLFKLRSGRLFSDLTLAPEMLSKGKLPLLPHRSAAHTEVAAIFKRFKEQRHLRIAQTGKTGTTLEGGPHA